jgi:hypothetical protein
MLVYPKPIRMTRNNLHDIIKHYDINRKGTRSYTTWLEDMNLIMISQFNENYVAERYTDTYTDREADNHKYAYKMCIRYMV